MAIVPNTFILTPCFCLFQIRDADGKMIADRPLQVLLRIVLLLSYGVSSGLANEPCKYVKRNPIPDLRVPLLARLMAGRHCHVDDDAQNGEETAVSLTAAFGIQWDLQKGT